MTRHIRVASLPLDMPAPDDSTQSTSLAASTRPLLNRHRVPRRPASALATRPVPTNQFKPLDSSRRDQPSQVRLPRPAPTSDPDITALSLPSPTTQPEYATPQYDDPVHIRSQPSIRLPSSLPVASDTSIPVSSPLTLLYQSHQTRRINPNQSPP